jgi:hypothetical protein
MSRPKPVWQCTIGVLGDHPLPKGADEPMRLAIQRVFREVTGRESEFIFSGWNAVISPVQLAVIEDRDPEPDLRCTLCGYPQSDCHCNRFGWR